MDMTNDEISLLNEVRPKRSFSLKVWDSDLPKIMVNRRISIQNIRSFKSVRRTSKWFLFKFSGSSGIEDRSDALEALTCLAANDSFLKRSISSDAFVPKTFSEDQETTINNLSLAKSDPDDPR